MKITPFFLSVFFIFAACKKDTEKVENQSEHTTESLIENSAAAEEADDLTISETDLSAITKTEDGSYSFRFKLKKGAHYPFVYHSNDEQKLTSGPQSVKMISTRGREFDYFVLDTVNQNFILKATFKRYTESSTGPDGVTLSYDTSKKRPGDPEVAANWLVYSAVVGESFEMTLDSKGRVKSVSGLDKVRTNVKNKLKNEFTAEELKGLDQILTASLSNEMIKNQFEENLNFLPDKNLKLGEKWEDSQNISEGPITGRSSMSRTFEKLEDNIATIAIQGTQNVSGKDVQGDMSAEMKAQSTLNGKVELDAETGWVRKFNLTRKEDTTTTMRQGDESLVETGSLKSVTTVN